MDRGLLARLDATEERARSLALRGFPAAARRHVIELGAAWLALNPEPSPFAQSPRLGNEWAEPMIEGAVAVSARSRAIGSRLETAIAPPPGVIVPGPVRSISAAAVPIQQSDADAAAEIVGQLIRPAMAQAAQELDQSMLDALGRISARAVADGWTVERYQGAIQRALATMGASSTTFQSSWIASWYRTLLTSAWAQGLSDRLSQEPTNRLWPYLEYEPRSDEKVRPNHAHLRGFAAPPGWFGWPFVRPANGYNCRCRLVPVSWVEARNRRWTGLFPGTSARILATWTGPDPGFK